MFFWEFWNLVHLFIVNLIEFFYFSLFPYFYFEMRGSLIWIWKLLVNWKEGQSYVLWKRVYLWEAKTMLNSSQFITISLKNLTPGVRTSLRNLVLIKIPLRETQIVTMGQEIFACIVDTHFPKSMWLRLHCK